MIEHISLALRLTQSASALALVASFLDEAAIHSADVGDEDRLFQAAGFASWACRMTLRQDVGHRLDGRPVLPGRLHKAIDLSEPLAHLTYAINVTGQLDGDAPIAACARAQQLQAWIAAQHVS